MIPPQSPSVSVGLVLGGELTGERLPLAIPSQFDHVLFVDGGIRHASTLGLRRPKGLSVWLGDGDSFGPEGPAHFSNQEKEWKAPLERIDYSTDKDFSDFAGALDFLNLRLGDIPLEVHLFAGLGGRRDHERLNVLEAERFAQKATSPVTLAFHPGVLVTNHRITLACKPERWFSVVLPEYPGVVSISGAHYSGDIRLLRPSHGLSNRATGILNISAERGFTCYLERSP